MSKDSVSKDIVFNHDGFSLLIYLEGTAMTEQDAANLLVLPLRNAGMTTIDWCIMSTAHHNCRTRFDLAYDGKGPGRSIDAAIGKVVTHYNKQKLDLLDIVVKHGHANGMEVFGNLRLNHSSLVPDIFLQLPGRNFGDATIKKDFRDATYHMFLCEILEDLLEKGVDGISLDFERKAPFFPDEAPQAERLEACRSFLRRVRALTEKPVAVRCAYESAKGAPQGQDPLGWMSEGLIDVVIPATHNHEPDLLNWPVSDFVDAARRSPRACRVWPQIWPTGAPWSAEESSNNPRHSAEAVRNRCRELVRQGADGVYFFNFCCDGWPTPLNSSARDYEEVSDIFMNIPKDKARCESIFQGLPQFLASAGQAQP